MLNELNIKQKITIIAICLMFVSLFGLLFFFIPQDEYGKGININGYDKYISNLPTNKRKALNSSLYDIVKSNLQSDNLDIKDANIRDASTKYDYDKDNNVNSGSFIVDMESIKQSYLISYRWSSDENNINLGDYSSVAECLPSDKVIFSDFDCKDGFHNEEEDPIFEYLPYSTFAYKITGNYNEDKLGLDVAIILAGSDMRDGSSDAAVEEYKVEVEDWIRSKKQNPDDYVINYTVE